MVKMPSEQDELAGFRQLRDILERERLWGVFTGEKTGLAEE